jgi:site-specific recombinase XerD
MKPSDFAIRLTQFFSAYLPAQRALSPNTIKAYRDAFTLLLRYCRDQRALPPEKLTLDALDVPLLLAFLDYLQSARRCCARTRNHRLSALHAFFRYLQTEEPDRILQCQQILAIPLQRSAPPLVHYLSREELTALLSQPNLTTRQGRRDAVLLRLLYDSGARAQELLDTCVRDVRLDAPAQIQLTGKGRKTRIVPLLSNTVELLKGYLCEHRLNGAECADSPLFFNRRGERLSRSGIRYILDKYAQQARSEALLGPTGISPHWLRHAKAMHLLQSGNPPPVIQAILGHADIRTTNIYAQADTEMKRRALEKAASATSPSPPLSWQEDKSLLNWLRSL